MHTGMHLFLKFQKIVSKMQKKLTPEINHRIVFSGRLSSRKISDRFPISLSPRDEMFSMQSTASLNL